MVQSLVRWCVHDVPNEQGMLDNADAGGRNGLELIMQDKRVEARSLFTHVAFSPFSPFPFLGLRRWPMREKTRGGV